MRPRRLPAAICLLLGLSAALVARTPDDEPTNAAVQVTAPDGATIYRVYLTDGTSLVSYGEPARVGDRIIFSMPTSLSLDNPPLHLVNLAASGVDWPRTERYTESARAAKYYATRGEADYAVLT